MCRQDRDLGARLYICVILGSQGLQLLARNGQFCHVTQSVYQQPQRRRNDDHAEIMRESRQTADVVVQIVHVGDVVGDDSRHCCSYEFCPSSCMTVLLRYRSTYPRMPYSKVLSDSSTSNEHMQGRLGPRNSADPYTASLTKCRKHRVIVHTTSLSIKLTPLGSRLTLRTKW